MSDRANILLIVCDQFRHDCIGAAGNPIIRTPHLDAFAREGVLFSRCFAQACPCGPSRMSLFTGRYMCSTRSVDNKTPLMDAEDNLAMYLRAAGYDCVISGYNDYALDPRICLPGDPRRTGLDYANFLPGFEVLLEHEFDSPEYFDYLRQRGYPEELCNHYAIHQPNVPPEGPSDRLPICYPAHYRAEDSECQFHTRRIVEWLRQPHAAPWFLSVNYIKPHSPRICAAPYHAMYDPATMPSPTRHPQELDDPHPYLRMVRRTPALTDERELRDFQSNYYGMISEIDACIGLLIQAVKDAGLWENTLIVFTADHGEYLGDHYLIDKNHLYDQAMRIPCIVRDPSPAGDAWRGRTLDAFCELVDIAPTICEYAGMPVPDRIQGQSMAGLVQSRPGAHPKWVIHYEYDFRGEAKNVDGADPDQYLLWVVRDDAFKYVQFGLESMPPMLFDLKRDPGEFHSLASDAAYASIVAEYCQKLLRWRMKNEDQRMEHWAYSYR